MKKKAVTIEPSELIGFLDQELNELPDKRKGDNKKYAVKDAVKAASWCAFPCGGNLRGVAPLFLYFLPNHLLFYNINYDEAEKRSR